MLRNIKKLFSGKIFYVVALVSIQVFILSLLIMWVADEFPPIYYILTGVSAVLAFWLLSKYENPSYKMIWLLIIVLLPVLGFLFYAVFGNKAAKRSIFKPMRERTFKGSKSSLERNQHIYEKLEVEAPDAVRQAEYIFATSGHPVYEGTETVYLKNGEIFFNELKKQLKSAKEYIYMEFFIVSKGRMWDEIMEILKEKITENVDVRLLCDDAGSNMPKKFLKEIRESGIKCLLFNPMFPVLSVKHNNRDHRKICVIDGETAFTGGINIADEYINLTSPLGYWLDMGIMIRGKAAESFEDMFLSTWNFLSKSEENVHEKVIDEGINASGYVLPYDTNPFINGDAAENIFLNMISRAKKYLYIASPYLVIDFAMEQALITAAKSGVKIKMLFPGIPDKELTYLMATKHFPNLIEAGVEIYKFSEGFMHGKLFLSDDDYGIVSTINLDFRSLFLHFEDGVWMYKTDCLKDMKKDFEQNFEKCKLVTLEEAKDISWFKKIVRTVIAPFAPLM